MATNEEPSRWEIEGRADKAQKLARLLRRAGVDQTTAASYVDEQWATAASILGMKKPPSEKCQGFVIGLLTPTPSLRKNEP